MFDFLVIGAGLFGATFANLAKKAGKSVLVIDKHIYIARNSHAVNGEKNTIIFAKHKELTNTQSKVIFRRASDRVQMLRHGRCD